MPEVHLPRPGHADLAGAWKFGFTDIRNVLERASARETAARVAGGALAKAFLRAVGVEVVSHVTQIGSVRAPERDDLALADFAEVDASPVRCLDPEVAAAMVEEINVLRKRNESLGGIFELRAFGLVPGLGSHVSWEERLDGRIGMALLSIQACKGVGLGDGFDLAGRPGSQAHDEIFYDEERGYFRETNHSGGLEGGMTTGEPLVVRAAMKPLPTLTKPLRSVDIATREPAQALRERTDSVVVPAAGRRGGGDARDRARRRLPAEVRRRPHRRRAGGAGRLRRADRVEAAGGLNGRALVFIGFMGAGKTTAARAAARGARRARGRLRPRARAADRRPDRRLLRRATARRRSASSRSRSCASCSTRPPGPVLSLGGGAAGSERVREALARHTVVLLDVDTATAWHRAAVAGRSRATASASRRCTRRAGRSTTGSPTSC